MRSGRSKRLTLLALGLGVVIAALAIGKLVVDGAGETSAGSGETGETFVTVSRSSNIAVLELATGRTRLLTHADGRYLSVASPTWSPSGRRIAFARQTCAHCPFRIAVASLGSGSIEPSHGWRNNATEPTWSPGGDRLIVATSEKGDRKLVLFRLGHGRGRALAIHADEADAEGAEEVEAPNHPAFAPDGRTVAFEAEITRERTRIFLLDLVSGEVSKIENEAVGNAYPAFSPTGKRLAFSQSDARFAWDVCTVRRDGRDQVCLTRGPANDVEPTWSADGRSIVFSSDRADPQRLTRSLYAIRPDGTGLRRLTKGFDDGAPAFSRDGTEVAFVRRQIHRIRR